MSADVMSVLLHLRGVRVIEVVVGRAGGCTTVANGRSGIWRSAALGRCCCGPSGGSYAGAAGGTWKPMPSFWVV